jgi:hypothetical protein
MASRLVASFLSFLSLSLPPFFFFPPFACRFAEICSAQLYLSSILVADQLVEKPKHNKP